MFAFVKIKMTATKESTISAPLTAEWRSVPNCLAGEEGDDRLLTGQPLSHQSSPHTQAALSAELDSMIAEQGALTDEVKSSTDLPERCAMDGLVSEQDIEADESEKRG